MLAFTGARPAEIVDNEKKRPMNGLWEELYGTRIVSWNGDTQSDGKSADEDACLLEDMLSQETASRGRPKALCYEDVCLTIARHPEIGHNVPTMAIKFAHHKGMDQKPRPYAPMTHSKKGTLTYGRTIFFFTGTRRLLFCVVTIIISLAVHDQAFDAPWLTTVASVFEVRNRGERIGIPLRWKKKWLKRPIFRGFDRLKVSCTKPLPYSKLSDDMERQTLDAGFEKALSPKAFRRGAANAANGMHRCFVI